MIYVNNVKILNDENIDEIIIITTYLAEKRMILINENGEPIDDRELKDFLSEKKDDHFLKAINISEVFRDLKEELIGYIKNVEEYIDNIRDTEDFSTVKNSFISVTEALLEFSSLARYLQKELIDHNHLMKLTEKSLISVENNNFDYVLDVIEYEFLPILHRLLNEMNEEM